MNYADLASHVTARLVARIEAGAGTWNMPWHTSLRVLQVRNAATGLPYRGANTITLAVAALDRGYPTGWWATYKQWTDPGAQVRRGETAARVVKWVPGRASDGDGDGDGDSQGLHRVQRRPGRRLTPPTTSTATVLERDGHADAWIAATRADISYGHNHACYRPALDRIELPAARQFTDRAAFYSTACHELVHWSGHQSRLARELAGRFGDDAYAAEELVAELGAAIACAHLAIAPSPRDDHAGYLAHWLRILGDDPKELFAVAAKAQAAVDHLDGYSTACLADDEAAA